MFPVMSEISSNYQNITYGKKKAIWGQPRLYWMLWEKRVKGRMSAFKPSVVVRVPERRVQILSAQRNNWIHYREVRKAVSAVSASKKEQATRVKKHVVRRQKGTMAAAPKSHVHVKKLTVEEGVRTGKNSVHQLQAQVDTATQQESSQGPVLLSQLPETTSVPYTPETMGQQLTVSLSGEPYGPSAMPSMCPSLILQPCATTDPMLLQPQGSSASNQASVSATLEWQEMLEAAEALLALKNSSQTRHQPCGMPGM
nr:doublesex- and mab-3-related transcription factor C1 isoform X3 [Rattus norvegicus]|eukprot:XP_017457813.1 PREDICTED: doublesex- and mab-3-related transcription factor C1 isoform X3 [Rattus norvegicus]